MLPVHPGLSQELVYKGKEMPPREYNCKISIKLIGAEICKVIIKKQHTVYAYKILKKERFFKKETIIQKGFSPGRNEKGVPQTSIDRL